MHNHSKRLSYTVKVLHPTPHKTGHFGDLEMLFPANFVTSTEKKKSKLECGPMPSLMAALPNIGDALC